MTVSTTSSSTTYAKQCSTPPRVITPLPAVGEMAQTPCDVAANLNLHSGLAEVDIAVVAQLKAHHVLHDPVKPLRIADKKVRRSEAIREVGDDGQGEPAIHSKDQRSCAAFARMARCRI